jgi:hypothetical protein
MTIPLLFLGLLALAFALHYPWTPKKRRSAGYEQLRRRHREIQRLQLGERYRDELGERYRDDGHALPQVLHIIGGVVLLHLTIAAIWFIVITVMGMQEPRW